MSYKELCLLAQQKKSPYTCCVGCIHSNGSRPMHFCRRSYQANYISSDEEEDEDETFPLIPPPIKRQTTQWIVNGQIVYNGNPNGDRLLSDDLLDDIQNK